MSSVYTQTPFAFLATDNILLSGLAIIFLPIPIPMFGDFLPSNTFSTTEMRKKKLWLELSPFYCATLCQITVLKLVCIIIQIPNNIYHNMYEIETSLRVSKGRVTQRFFFIYLKYIFNMLQIKIQDVSQTKKLNFIIRNTSYHTKNNVNYCHSYSSVIVSCPHFYLDLRNNLRK